jgi:hypothetical protein
MWTVSRRVSTTPVRMFEKEMGRVSDKESVMSKAADHRRRLVLRHRFSRANCFL